VLVEFLAAVSAVLGRDLNPRQREAVRAGASESLFLVAGPGSGKTTVLALRVLKLVLADSVEPTAVIATTFTRKAAKELRSRILGWGDQIRAHLLTGGLSPAEKARIAAIDFNAVWTGTFDSFAEEVLGNYRPPGAPAPAVIEDFVAQALMLRYGLFDQQRFRDRDLTEYIALVRGGIYGLSTAAKASTLNEIRQRVLHDDVDLAAYLSTADEPCGLCNPHPHDGVPVVGDALTGYENFLTTAEIVDYAALERGFLDKLRSGELDPFIESVSHVLVDEYQDTNLLQEQIYFHLAASAASRGGSITVVGDDDQALYRFRGATVELFRDFPTRVQAAIANVAPQTIFLVENYRSTDAIVAFCNNFIQLDQGFQAVRVARKPAITADRSAPHNPPVLGMFRSTVADLARDLAAFIVDIFSGQGYQLPSGDVIRASPNGSVGDCALLTFSPAEVKNGRDRLPRLLRQELASLPTPVPVFNPRGTELADVAAIAQLCGLALECIDPGGTVQASTSSFPAATGAVLTRWRGTGQQHLAALPSGLQRPLSNYISSWQTRTARSVSRWPTEISIADLVYKLVTWIPAMQSDIEGLVQFEVILRTITEAARFSTYSGNIVFRDPTRFERSVRAAIWEIFAPLAEGAIDIDEDLLETLPPNRLNVLSIHQSKGLEFPLTIVDVGSDFRRNHHAQAFQRFPRDGASTHRLEDELRSFSRSLAPTGRSGRDRAFDDLIRSYFVAFSRAQDVLLLVGLDPVADGRIPHVAVGWDRSDTFHWGAGLPNLEHV
jgi:DNA helicase II / ATP-dependent DNA helicase PcrA